MSPIKYALVQQRCFLITFFRYADVLYTEDDIDEEYEQKYIPDVLLSSYPSPEKEVELEEVDDRSNEVMNETPDSPGYGTFVKDLVNTEHADAINDTEKLIEEDS